MTKHEQVSADVRAFLERGGVIQVIPMGVTSNTIEQLIAAARESERAVAMAGARPLPTMGAR